MNQESSSIVLRGTFHPDMFHPEWFFRHKILAKQSFTLREVSCVEASFRFGNSIHVLVRPELLSLLLQRRRCEDLLNLMLSVFATLGDIQVSKMGINTVFELERSKFCFPFNLVAPVADSEVCSFVYRTDKNRYDVLGYTYVVVRELDKECVEVEINDHYEGDRAALLGVLKEHGSAACKRAEDIVKNLLSAPPQPIKKRVLEL